MRRLSRASLVLVALIGMAWATVVCASPQAAGQPSAPAILTAQGELMNVDTDAKTLEIKPSTGMELVFTYNDQTKVTGTLKDTAGLATKKGSEVTVHYRMESGKRVATSIEVKPAS